jgi:hypothetical protein
VNSSRHSWRTFLRRRVLIRPEDRVALHLADRLTVALVTDKGGPDAVTAGEAALIENATIARVCASLCLAEIGRTGAFVVGADAGRVASPALKELSRFVSAERQALQALGLERRAKRAVTLDEYLTAKAAGERQDAIPAEAKVVQ